MSSDYINNMFHQLEYPLKMRGYRTKNHLCIDNLLCIDMKLPLFINII